MKFFLCIGGIIPYNYLLLENSRGFSARLIGGPGKWNSPPEQAGQNRSVKERLFKNRGTRPALSKSDHTEKGAKAIA
jgi:hypothetical protein